MRKPKNLGEFEILVLAALLRLGENAYGARVRTEIEAKTDRKVSVGALYATLARLEDKDLVISKMGEATAVRGGRAKRYYELTAVGREKLNTAILGLNAMLEGVPVWKDLPIR